MSIIIHNIGGDLLGVCEYEVCINQRQITTFKHNRPDGLTVCLQKAAKACEGKKWEDTKRFFEEASKSLGRPL